MTIEVDIERATGSTLLESIERGDRIDLQKDGRTVATVTPLVLPKRTPEQIAQARQALADMDALGRELNLGPFDFEQFKIDRDSGRR